MRWAREENERSAFVDAARWSSLGIYMAACIGLCTYLGMLADHKWHSETTGTIVGFFLGVAAAFYGLFKELRRLPKDE